MKGFRARTEDSTFELNLAPMLDIIVSIIPMLLLSVAFVHLTVVETPIPQAVAKAIAEEQKHPQDVSVTLYVAADKSMVIVLKSGSSKEAKTSDIKIAPLASGAFNLDELHAKILATKLQFPSVFRLELHPEESMALNEIVGVMDQVRNRKPADPKILFNDVDSGKSVETDLLFPDVVFGNVAGGE